jgi:hypothetical protein
MRNPGRFTASLALLVLAVGIGRTAEYGVTGKKLLLRTPGGGPAGNRIVHLGTGDGIVVGQEGSAGDPRCVGVGSGGTSSLRLTTAGATVEIPLPCYGWSLNGSKTAYTYKDPSGATCKLVLVRNGALAKAICKGPQLGVALGPGVAPVTAVLKLNADVFCATYGGTVIHDGSDGTKLLHRDAPAPVSCPSTTSTTTTGQTTSTTLACCILYAGQCTWSPSEYACIVGGGVSIGEPGSACDGVSGNCIAAPDPGYCCAYPEMCTSGPTGDPMDCQQAGGTVYSNATCTADGACNPQ